MEFFGHILAVAGRRATLALAQPGPVVDTGARNFGYARLYIGPVAGRATLCRIDYYRRAALPAATEPQLEPTNVKQPFHGAATLSTAALLFVAERTKLAQEYPVGQRV